MRQVLPAMYGRGFGRVVNVRTPLVEDQIADQAVIHGISADEVVERIMLAPAAVRRLIEPDEVAGLVLYQRLYHPHPAPDRPEPLAPGPAAPAG